MSIASSSLTGESPPMKKCNLHVDDKEKKLVFSNCRTYLLNVHVPDIIRILLEEDLHSHHAIKVDACDLLDKHEMLTDMLFFKPEETLQTFDWALHEVLLEVYSNHMLKSHMLPKPHVHVRLSKMPTCSEIWRDRTPKSKDIGRLLAVEGTVIRTTSAKILEYRKEYMCCKCKNVFVLETDFHLQNTAPIPLRCPVGSDCPSKKFVAVSGKDAMSGPKKCKDYQEIKIQEQVRKLSMGTIPRSITVILEDDLVDCCKAGDDIVVVGYVACRWNPLLVGKLCDLELTIRANSVEVWNEKHSSMTGVDTLELRDEFECFWAAHGERTMTARNHILSSLCPQIYGLYVVKLAVALVLAGGVPRADSTGSRVRGECHLLLVGDPGTGKSQFLKYTAKIIPRSVITTGIGSSAAGLTVSAIRDGPHWTLEAGALVLADGGICCIDEFSSIKEHDRAAIHEAMEQQTISVAKAGLVCKLNTRTTILAATNPKLGTYDESASVSVNTAMASPLLSRFDLVLVLLDAKNLLWDTVVADYLLCDKSSEILNALGQSNLWTLEQMQGYFAVIHQLTPSLSPEADQVLRAYYRAHRQAGSRNAARTTIRLLESLIRLSEAHARLMFRNTVTIQDAVAAITVMESSMAGCALLPTGSILHSRFPEDAEAEYHKHACLVLNCLGLDHLLSSSGNAPGNSGENESCDVVNEDRSLPSQADKLHAEKSDRRDELYGRVETSQLNRSILNENEKRRGSQKDTFFSAKNAENVTQACCRPSDNVELAHEGTSRKQNFELNPVFDLSVNFEDLESPPFDIPDFSLAEALHSKKNSESSKEDVAVFDLGPSHNAEGIFHSTRKDFDELFLSQSPRDCEPSQVSLFADNKPHGDAGLHQYISKQSALQQQAGENLGENDSKTTRAAVVTDCNEENSPPSCIFTLDSTTIEEVCNNDDFFA